MNIAALLETTARSEGARTAVAVGTRPVATYRELADAAARLAHGFATTLRLRPGDRIALAMKNRAEYLECLFACWYGGFVAVPVNAKLHAREVAYIVADAGATACVTDAAAAQPLHAALAEIGATCTVVVAGDAAYATLGGGGAAAMAEVAPDDVAWLFYTSGTTGNPKGAMLTHRNLVAMTLNYFADMDAVEPGETMVHPAPLSHGSGLYALPHIAKGSTHVIPASGGFEVDEMLAIVQAYPKVSFFAVPTMIVRLTAGAGSADTAHLKTIVYGGAPMYGADMKRAIARFGNVFVQLYGQGESPMTITGLSRAQHVDRGQPEYDDRLGSVGVARTGSEVRVVDDAGTPLPPGETGEIITRGDVVMAGYWNNPKATADALRDGWLYTGDVGAFDADGYLHLKDRSKDVIISGGSNIYPREVEEVLLKHPGVAEAAVIGQPHPDWGEEIVAYVVRAPGSACTAQELGTFCLDYVARYKRPRRIHFVEALPKSGYGKVLKTALRALGTSA